MAACFPAIVIIRRDRQVVLHEQVPDIAGNRTTTKRSPQCVRDRRTARCFPAFEATMMYVLLAAAAVCCGGDGVLPHNARGMRSVVRSTVRTLSHAGHRDGIGIAPGIAALHPASRRSIASSRRAFLFRAHAPGPGFANRGGRGVLQRETTQQFRIRDGGRISPGVTRST